MAPRRLLPALLGALATATMAAAAPAFAQASEQAVKAAFVPKFARYVGWPPAAQPGAGQPYYLCVIGRDPFGALIDRAAASEVIDGHPVAVRRFASIDFEAVAGCHLAFIAGANDAATAQMVEGLKRQAVLTITDARNGHARGMIHFAVVAGRVRFSIDQGTAAGRGITISSRLLALAVEVKP
ncbi:YfiR family protein [Sphingomonas sp. LB-2]|uniref:YfiR family protein n=1 Tax=Sphingomonas caeni TaxID=2984949 RepID=UPI00222F35C8|nr:YfiR family protein [Sphingomonas caeni]MCW3845868.1 YfiR family protein [Sphingomonas caeni]